MGLVIGFGWVPALVGLLVTFGAGVIAQISVLPKRDSRHLTVPIFNSMSRRYVDYERDGDKQRTAAMAYLLERFVAVYGEQITKAGR